MSSRSARPHDVTPLHSDPLRYRPPRGGSVGGAGLSRSFGELQALQRFELELAGGECVAVLGRNGSGKTTAVRLIAGLLEPSEGMVEVCGARIDREPSAIEARTALAVVPDSPRCTRT